MRQVLFWIPLRSVLPGLPSWFPDSVPIYGYGMMLFLAFVVTSWYASRRARKEGINPQHLQDLALWLFVTGIAGARITYMIQYHVPIWDFFKIWQGGLVFYGSMIGGVIGFFAVYFLIIRKHNLSVLKLADIIAPCIAIGLALGRVGCLLNGCCWGHVDTNVPCPAITFPLSAPAFHALVDEGNQTAAGFLMRPNMPVVDRVVPDSDAAQQGLRAGDMIVSARSGSEELPVMDFLDHWPRGRTDLTLTVRRTGESESRTITLHPRSLPLIPTQPFETITALLLFFLLVSYLPFRRRDGELMALLMCLYPIHRFLDEILRNDTDPVAFHMTLSQNLSIICIVAGLVLFWRLRRQPAVSQSQPVAAPALAAR